MSAKEQVKIIMVKERLTAEKLAEKMTEYTGKKYTRQSISHKVSLSSFRFDEVKAMADMFGYEITITKI